MKPVRYTDNSNTRCSTKACPYPRDYGSTLCTKCTAMHNEPAYFQGTSITAATMQVFQSHLAEIESRHDEE